MKIQQKLAHTFLAVGFIASFTGCGNGWISSKQRESSPSALMLKGNYAYDKGNFESATGYYQSLLDADPTNAQARIRLAYALNAQANLSPLSLVQKLSSISTTPTPSSTAGTSSSNSISVFTGLVGLSSLEKTMISQAAPAVTTAAQLRSLSARFALLHQSWKVICQLLPASVLNTALGTDQKLKASLEAEVCKGGLTDASDVKTTAMFAATMNSLAQATGMYQAVLDDGNGNIKIVDQAKTIIANLEVIQKSSTTETDPQKLTNQMNALSDNLTQLANIGKIFQSELVNLTLGHFAIVASMSAAIGLPDSVNASISKAVTSFNDAKAKINDYLAPGSAPSGGAPSGTQNKIKDAAAKASVSIDAIVAKQPMTPENHATLVKACSNFNTFLTTYSLPPDTQKPKSCQSASLSDSSDFVNFSDDAKN